MPLSCIAQFNTPAEASMAQGMLESHGIRSIVDNGTILSVIPIPSTIGGARLMVNSDDVDEAIRLLREHGDLDR